MFSSSEGKNNHLDAAVSQFTVSCLIKENTHLAAQFYTLLGNNRPCLMTPSLSRKSGMCILYLPLALLLTK